MSVGERRVSMLQVGEYEGGGRLRTFFGDPTVQKSGMGRRETQGR